MQDPQISKSQMDPVPMGPFRIFKFWASFGPEGQGGLGVKPQKGPFGIFLGSPAAIAIGLRRFFWWQLLRVHVHPTVELVFEAVRGTPHRQCRNAMAQFGLNLDPPWDSTRFQDGIQD